MDAFLNDIRYAIRNLIKRPGFTLIAVLTLGIGIGANSAMFSAIYALLMKPSLFRMSIAWWQSGTERSNGGVHDEVTLPNYIDWRDQSQSFEQLALYRWWNANLTGIEPPERLQGFLVTANSSMLRTQADHGPQLHREENQPGKDAVAIISHSLWQRRLRSKHSQQDDHHQQYPAHGDRRDAGTFQLSEGRGVSTRRSPSRRRSPSITAST